MILLRSNHGHVSAHSCTGYGPEVVGAVQGLLGHIRYGDTIHQVQEIILDYHTVVKI
jgi:hypothetical protein